MRATTRLAARLLAVTLTIPIGLSAQSEVYVIRGATVHTMAGDSIESGTVVLQDGRIAAVGASVSAPAGAQEIDGTGLHLYPGLFDPFSQLGLTEIGQVQVTNDMRELGDFNPHLMASMAVHPASEHIPVARANGITHTVTAPQANSGGLGGQASLIHLDGWTIEEMAINTSVGMVLSWPTIQMRRFNRATFQADEKSYKDAKKERDEQLTTLKERFGATREYLQAAAGSNPPVRDLKMEGLGRVVRGEIPLLVQVNTERAIRAAMEFAEEQEVRIIIAGGREAWKMADELAAANVPVILSPTQALPTGADEAYDEAFTAPGALHDAGVQFAFASFSSASSRNLPYEAAMAVGFGLPWDAAYRALTLNGAEMFGAGDDLGTIEVGKIGNLILTDGDPLAIQTQVTHLFIGGHPVSTDNKHLSLYEKYRAR